MDVLSAEIQRKLRLVRAKDGLLGLSVTQCEGMAADVGRDLITAVSSGFLCPQATEAETKEDREIICEEVFCDITGQLDFAAKGGQSSSSSRRGVDWERQCAAARRSYSRKQD